MAHPDAVKAALATLARGGPARRTRPPDKQSRRDVPEPPEPDPSGGELHDAESVADSVTDAEAVIDTAERAFEDVDLAADFIDEVGVDALEAAVERASAVGADDVARRGRRLLDDLDAYREAADSDGVEHDHFRPGRGTLLRGAGLAGDR